MLFPLALLLFAIELVLAKVPWIRHPPKQPQPGRKLSRAQVTRQPQSSRRLHRRDVPGGKINPWKPFTTDEAALIVAFLHNNTVFNLVPTQDSGPRDNSVNVIDLHPPPKAEVFRYLDGDAPEPERYARVVIYFQDSDEPYAEEFLVGPVPITGASTIVPLVHPSSNTSRIRIWDADFDEMNTFARAEADTMAEVVQDLLGAAPDAFGLFGSDPLPNEDNRIIAWLGFWGRPTTADAVTLSPQGLAMHFDFTGRDPAGWKFLGWYWNGEYYDSHDAFRTAWSAPGFEKPARNNAVNSTWITTDRAGETHAHDLQAPPTQVQPDGQRFTIDEEERYVEWMGWRFFMGWSRSTGLRLHDVRFKNERIFAELGLDEAIAHYAGADPIQSHTAYLDSFYGFGRFAMSLVPGFDCPAHAAYLDTTIHQNEISTTHRGSICIFESEDDHLLQHLVLIVRFVSTIGNYDYTFDYVFYLDGSLEVIVRASGYIQGAYWAKNGDYGYRIAEGFSGSMHEHVLTFAADLDIFGTANSMYRHSIVPDKVKYSWSTDERNTMRVQKDIIKSEDEGRLSWSPESMYFIGNAERLNAWGEAPGYSFKPSRGPPGKTLTITDSPNLRRSAAFATSPLFVTVQRDSEACAAHFTSTLDPNNPLVDFSKFLDGDNLEQKDLKIYFNLGMMHVPNTADLPNTVMTTAQAGLMFSPHNMFDTDASRSSHQMARMLFDPETDGVAEVDMYGSTFATGSLDLDSLQPNLTSYVVESQVRKFPYEPLNVEEEDVVPSSTGPVDELEPGEAEGGETEDLRD